MLYKILWCVLLLLDIIAFFYIKYKINIIINSYTINDLYKMNCDLETSQEYLHLKRLLMKNILIRILYHYNLMMIISLPILLIKNFVF